VVNIVVIDSGDWWWFLMVMINCNDRDGGNI
jgi:hypothetical protein